MFSTFKRTSQVTTLALIVAVALVSASCGGGGGGSEGAGRGLVLLSFSESGVDNAVLNQRLEFRFSEGVDPSTITNASIQIREGDAFGLTVPGIFLTSGSTVIFEPTLASLCDQSDSGFKPDTQYRVQLMGFPEQFAVRNMSGQSLDNTRTYEFHTRLDTDPEKYADQVPGVGPEVVTTSPADGAAAVTVESGNRIEIEMTENLNPCTVTNETVLVQIYELGDPTIFAGPNSDSGFSSGGDISDGDTFDHSTWDASDGVITSFASDPVTLLCDVTLLQDFNETKIVATPLFGFANGAAKFPENALIVVTLKFDIEDFGNLPMQPKTFSFTTQNLNLQTSSYTIENKGETSYIKAETTAAVHPDPRSPERVQAFMLFAGDGDNGPLLNQPSLPKKAPACLFPLQGNSGGASDFFPQADEWLDTGSTRNTCVNETDGSTAVVWEFATFRIPANVTVRVVGKNPAIILVQGDVIIDNAGRLLVRGDGVGLSPKGDGRIGTHYQGGNDGPVPGGIGVAGGGDGGTGEKALQAHKYGDDGYAGLGSPSYDPTMTNGGIGEDGVGAGRAGQPAGASNSSNPWDGESAGGGGAGHATAGTDGDRKSGNNYKLYLAPRGQGGATYERSGNSGDRLQLPEAGSGGGSAGFENARPFHTSSSYRATGGSGGAGGGFVDLTSSGDITILGTLDAAGGKGGNGTGWNQYNSSGGGGGGSGGGVRLLTPNDVIFSATTVVSVAGGLGGIGKGPSGNVNNRNNGGVGGHGRLVIETGNSIVTGLANATMTPGEGDVGFYRGQFDATRFKGGGLTPKATTDLIPIGNHAGFDPTFMIPQQNYAAQQDFVVGVPTVAAPGTGKVAILVEVRGYQMLTDGTADTTPANVTPWFSVGHFLDTGISQQPQLVLNHPADLVQVPYPGDNAGPANQGFGALNSWLGGGYEYIQVRMTMYLPTSVGPFDAGAFVDDWTIWFQHNQ